MTEYVINKIKQVSSKKEFDYLLENFKTSNQPLEVRDEAIEVLRKHYPMYDESNRLPTKELLKQIKEGEADIDDIN